MTKAAKTTGEPGSTDAAPPVEPQECGIVMPISPTSKHDAAHWARVQTLLHRGVKQAGLEPKNVWTGSATDRITVRILGNLFEVPIALCDISDLNPNVMLELGMRLTSKKPTIVVAETGSSIPFDIRDFEALFYPADLNILDMEKFFEELVEQLNTKLAAFNNDTYQPFLQGIGPIDFLEPAGRALPFEELVTQQLETLVERVELLDQRTRSMRATSTSGRVSDLASRFAGSSLKPDLPTTVTIHLTEDAPIDKAAQVLTGQPNVYGVEFTIELGKPALKVHYKRSPTIGVLKALEDALAQEGIVSDASLG